MKKILLALVLFTSIIYANGQSTDSTLDIVNWNVEWFGSATNGPANKALQEKNVIAILRYLNADLYALTEVVNPFTLERVVDSLGEDYNYELSDFCSLAASPVDRNWEPGQKLAFIYRKSIFSGVKTRGFLRTSNSAYNNFASGRFPYQLSARVTIDIVARNINFFLIHGKSGSTSSDYDRRKGGASEMKDSLDKFYPTATNIILGDFNDDLDKTISSGSGTLSSYDKIVKDSTDSIHYVSITLPLSYAGENSTISYRDVIDHQVISDEADSMYIRSSVAIRKDVLSVVPDYNTRNTSDHYPVFSQFKLIAGDTSAIVFPIDTSTHNTPPVVIIVTPPFTGFKLWPNPFRDRIFIKTGKALNDVVFELYNLAGQKVWGKQQLQLPAQVENQVQLPQVPAGLYFLRLTSKELSSNFTLLKSW
jgi:hypothetical protein